jgi:hypothetical protein
MEEGLIGFGDESKLIGLQVIEEQTVMAGGGPENEFEKSL